MIRAHALVFGAASVLLAAQIETFEAASIRVRSGDRVTGGLTTADRFVRPDSTLRDLIRFAWNLQDFQIEGGPDWIASSRFEVNAKAATAVTPDAMRGLVRRLLQDRFALKPRVEARELPLFELVTARTCRGDACVPPLGEHLRASTMDCEALLQGRPAPPTAQDRAQCDLRFRPKMSTGPDGRPAISTMTLTLQGTTMSRLAALLQNEVQRAVVDRTGLEGTFDLELEFAPQARVPLVGLPAPPSPPSDGPPLMTALQEQLGLKLQSAPGPVSTLVIDGANQPAPD
jgi:uncharacterized protein (TIGR03435 family)